MFDVRGSGFYGTVENFRNIFGGLMATDHNNVSNGVTETFNAVFAGRNKSAIIPEPMSRGIEEEKNRQRRAEAIDRLLARRKSKQPVDRSEIQSEREALR
jgi:hypothetical protein